MTTELKDAILGAFEDVGGRTYLAKVATENMAVFCTLLGKVLPTQVTGEDGEAIQVSVIEHIITRPTPSDKDS